MKIGIQIKKNRATDSPIRKFPCPGSAGFITKPLMVMMTKARNDMIKKYLKSKVKTDVEFLELFLIQGSWCVDHDIPSGVVLWEGNEIAYGLLPT